MTHAIHRCAVSHQAAQVPTAELRLHVDPGQLPPGGAAAPPQALFQAQITVTIQDAFSPILGVSAARREMIDLRGQLTDDDLFLAELIGGHISHAIETVKNARHARYHSTSLKAATDIVAPKQVRTVRSFMPWRIQKSPRIPNRRLQEP